ncbi:hypothetical protein FF38_01411 [Lucilia cuprina]|uniref:Uncharacterized protein n=1 Tax=Lucilia cuprina TaxID=7375 RepID=A0A0L0CAC4_LUCCU|nr:hypothetical protein CVS40_7908 [Lucilia cuprina]KNC29206.1 hypothetical protein FF38_01411 [Lucilia cuprina]
MFKFLIVLLLAIIAYASAKPHLLTTGVNYAVAPALVTPVVAAAAVHHPVVAATAVHTPVIAAPAFAAPAYYPHYATASYATYPSYAVYPHLGGAAYYVRQRCQTKKDNLTVQKNSLPLHKEKA